MGLDYSWPEGMQQLLGKCTFRGVAIETLLPNSNVFDFIKNDGHTNLYAKLSEVASAIPRRRCSIHEMTNVHNDSLIGDDVEIYEFSTLRDRSIICDGARVGFGTELTRTIIGNRARVAHRATLSDVAIGASCNIGAGVVCPTLGLFTSEDGTGGKVRIRDINGDYADTGRSKFGAVIGKSSSIGANCTVGPGAILGSNSKVYAGVVIYSRVTGPDMVHKLRQNIECACNRGCQTDYDSENIGDSK